MKQSCIVVCLVGFLTGCTDSIESVTREYRNANNEMLDAMMMVTSEQRAADMTVRVFSSARERYKTIDGRLNTVLNNSTKKDFIKSVFESDGAHLYLTELEVNSQRFSLETLRLRNLVKQYLEEAGEAGDDGAQKVCPKLFALTTTASPLEELRTQLTKPKLADIMEQFPSWAGLGGRVDPKDYEKFYAVFEKKRKEFPVKDITLIW